MKRDIFWYVDRCMTCCIIKAKHQRSHVKFQPLEIHMWKREQILMDFITKLRKTYCGVDTI